MALVNTGKISHSDIVAEFQDTLAGWRLSQDGGVILQSLGDPKGPGSMIKESDFYGLSNSVEYTLWDFQNHAFQFNLSSSFGVGNDTLKVRSNTSQWEYAAYAAGGNVIGQQTDGNHGGRGILNMTECQGINIGNTGWYETPQGVYSGQAKLANGYSNIGISWTNHKKYFEFRYLAFNYTSATIFAKQFGVGPHNTNQTQAQEYAQCEAPNGTGNSNIGFNTNNGNTSILTVQDTISYAQLQAQGMTGNVYRNGITRGYQWGFVVGSTGTSIVNRSPTNFQLELRKVMLKL